MIALKVAKVCILIDLIYSVHGPIFYKDYAVECRKWETQVENQMNLG